MKVKKTLTPIISLLSLGIATTLVGTIATQNVLSNDVIYKEDVVNNQENNQYPIYPAQSNGQNSFLSTKTGPLVYWNNEIKSLDWFGAERWKIDMAKITNITSYGNADWQRSWFNWDYDRTRDILWVLGFGANNAQQTLYSFNGITGELTGSYPLIGRGTDIRFITALVSGKVWIYGGAKHQFNGQVQMFNPETQKIEMVKGNSAEGLKLPDKFARSSKWYFYNIIPLANNKNIVQLMNFPNSPSSGDNGASQASFQIDFLLVDDSMNFIADKNSQSQWKQQYTAIPEGVKGYRNTTVTPQRDYYFLLDGRVVTVIYNTVVIIDPNSNDSKNSNVSIYKYKLDPEKWVLSWSFDTNENLFFKYKKDTKVYRVKASELKNTSTAVSPITYFDIANASDEISKYADNYILYNVYGYRGQIILINAWYSDRIRNNEAPNEQKIKENEYGLQVAITENENNQEEGDTLGVLNGSKSFQKSADFNIETNILTNKLPSEITRNDLTLLNNGFFTTNQTKENGNLKYPPFKLDKINDSNGSFEITVNLDQIPWFASTLPTDAIPKTIKKSFDNTATISQKVSWNDNLSYDLKNTLPSKVELKEIQEFNPFQVSFNSRTVINSDGSVKYPKTTYEIKSRDDSTGKIVIDAIYEYMPVSNEVNQPQTYRSSKTYDIFKKDANRQFYFAGSDTKASSSYNKEINVNNVSQLKGLSESNLLPSSFNANDKNSFLQFVNTNQSMGYPISKMNFKVEANDIEGSLTIIASMPKGYYFDTEEVFKQKYVGLNKKDNYSFAFKNSVTNIGKTNISQILPNAVTDGDIVENFIDYKGYNSSDFSIELYPNDENGSLKVIVNLDKNYSNILGNSHGFKNYKVEKVFTGFLNRNDFNKQYSITFKDNSDKSLFDLKKLTLSEIKTKLDSNSLVIGGKHYKNLNQLVEELLIQDIGDKIPRSWADNNFVKTELTFNNESGTMGIILTIDNSIIPGYESNISEVASYSGFVKGNITATKDNLSFINQDSLFTIRPEVASMNAKEFNEWVKIEENFNKILLSVTGQYLEILNSKTGYQITTDVNEFYNTVTITITFDQLKNPQSLKQYSIQYKLN